ncbi:hypothetical protein ACIQ9Q_41825 [Streptomyces sp. NPDC094438]|uniref:hypothetical protein n=1 Tax=Streptomyces sp. NPDC094438 TaxID=3366061 RepID=UPI0038241436
MNKTLLRAAAPAAMACALAFAGLTGTSSSATHTQSKSTARASTQAASTAAGPAGAFVRIQNKQIGKCFNYNGTSTWLGNICNQAPYEVNYYDGIGYRYNETGVAGACLGANPGDRRTVGSWTCNDDSSLWFAEMTGDGYMVLKNRRAVLEGWAKQCLDIGDGHSADLHECMSGNDYQRWTAY